MAVTSFTLQPDVWTEVIAVVGADTTVTVQCPTGRSMLWNVNAGAPANTEGFLTEVNMSEPFSIFLPTSSGLYCRPASNANTSSVKAGV